ALRQPRHVVLVGDEGVGKRSLVYSLAHQLAEENGRGDIRSVVQINESALLENPLTAVRAGLRRASGGILLVPHIERFFAERLQQQFPEAVSRELHKALLGDEQLIIGTTVPGEYERLRQNKLIRQYSN